MAMVRRIEFNDADDLTNKHRFYLMYQGFVTGGQSDVREPPKGMVIVRREAKLLEKLEGISEPEIGAEGQPTGYRVLTGNLLILEQPEYELLKKYLDRAPWAAMAARKIIDLWDWLDSIPLVEGKVDG